MSERYFALIGEDGYVYPVFFDSENEDKEIDVDVVVDLLNENEQLKFQLDECRNHKLFSRRELEEENEQLKQEIKAKDKIIELYYEMVKE